jgi:integrase/recombinase XerD
VGVPPRLRLVDAIEQFLEGYFATNDRSRKTSDAYALDLRQFYAFAGAKKTVRSIRPETIESWALKLKNEGYATASIRRKLASVRGFFAYWTRKRAIPFSPMSGLRVELAASRTLPTFMTIDEVAAILREASRRFANGGDFLSLRNLAIIEVLFATGMRVGELVSLRLTDMRPDDRSLLIRGKGRRERLAFFVEPISYARITDYQTLRTSTPSLDDSLFVNAAGRPLTTQSVANILRDLCTAAGIAKHVTPHTFRHTVATLLLRNGADIRVVQELLGHSSITMTQRYTHVVKDQMVRVVTACHPRGSLRE